MVIAIGNFRLRPATPYSFDMEELVEKTSKDGRKYMAREIVGYGMRLEVCIHQAIMGKLARIDEMVSARKFVEMYISEKNEVLNLFDESKITEALKAKILDK